MKKVVKLLGLIGSTITSIFTVGLGCTPGRLYGPAPVRGEEVPDADPNVLDETANKPDESPSKEDDVVPDKEETVPSARRNRDEIEVIYGPPEMFGMKGEDDSQAVEEQKEAMPERTVNDEPVAPIYGMPMPPDVVK